MYPAQPGTELGTAVLDVVAEYRLPRALTEYAHCRLDLERFEASNCNVLVRG